MAIISFYTNCREETGNTISAVVFATYMGITKNKKMLLLPTGLNDNTIKEALWPEQIKKKTGLFGANTGAISQSGIEDLDRMIRSNRISPDIISNYTRVALKERLEAINCFNGEQKQYNEIKEHFKEIILLANKVYELVIVDVDKSLGLETVAEILNISDVVVNVTSQKLKNIEKMVNYIEKDELLKKYNTIMAIGKYNDDSKYNMKNISRNILRQRKMINTIPYNTLVFEALQEGRIIDVLVSFLDMKIKDKNEFFLQEVKRLSEDIENKITEVQMKKSMK